MRRTLALLALAGLAVVAQADVIDFATDDDLDHSASSENYIGAIFRVGADGAATSRMFVGGHDTPQPTDVNTPISGTVNVTLDPGSTADLNLGLLIVGGAGGRQNVGTLKFNQTDVTIDANAIWFGYCHNKANRNPQAYVTFDGADVTINVGEVRHGWASGDGCERYVQTRHVNGGSFTLNVTNHIKQGYHSPVIEATGSGSYETMSNFIDLNGADKVVIAVGGSWYIGTGRGGSGEFRADACTDLTVTISGTLKLGGTNPDSTDARNHLAIAKFGTTTFANWYDANVTVADVILSGSGRRTTPVDRVGPSQIELHGAHMHITNSLAISTGDTIKLVYTHGTVDPEETWLRMAESDQAALLDFITAGKIIAATDVGEDISSLLQVNLDGGFAYVQVPEPASLLLMGVGGALALLRRRRQAGPARRL